MNNFLFIKLAIKTIIVKKLTVRGCLFKREHHFNSPVHLITLMPDWSLTTDGILKLGFNNVKLWDLKIFILFAEQICGSINLLLQTNSKSVKISFACTKAYFNVIFRWDLIIVVCASIYPVPIVQNDTVR